MRKDETSLASRVLNSAIYSVGSNVLQRTIGLASMLILARLLTPRDYGIVAAALLVVELFNELSKIGINQYILSKTELSAQDLNTAWTLQLGIRTFLALIIVIFSAPLASLFDYEALRTVLCAAAMVPLIQALQNPGLLLLQRDYSYKAISFINILSKLLGVICGIAVAIVFKSYWALIVNTTVAATTLMIFSYMVHVHRPQLCLKNIGAQWNFSQWNLARAIVGYSRSKADNFLVSKLFGIENLGFYTLSKQLATLPHEHLTSPIADIVTSTIGGNEQRKASAHRSLTKLLVATICIILPFTLVFIVLTDEIVLLLLGEKWNKNAELIQLLAPLSVTFSACALISTSLVAIGRVKEVFILDFLTLLVVLLCLGFAANAVNGVEFFAQTRTFAGLLVLIISYLFAKRYLALNTISMLISLIPIAISGGITAITLAALISTDQAMSWTPFFRLFIGGGLALMVYIATLCTLLVIVKRPTDELLTLKKLMMRIYETIKIRLVTSGERF